MGLFEAALFALVLTKSDQPFWCRTTASSNYVCSNGLVVLPIGPAELDFSNGVKVKKGDKGSLVFSNGLKSWIDITGAAQFENGVGLTREEEGRQYRVSNGLVCRLINDELVRCFRPKAH